VTPLALFVALALATHRIVRLAQRDHITLRWREAALNRWPPDAVRQSMVAKWEPKLQDVAIGARPGDPLRWPPVSRFGYWLTCPWCFGFVASALAVLAVQPWASTPLPVVWWLALSSAVGLLSGAER
jgi:hypothetical protein